MDIQDAECEYIMATGSVSATEQLSPFPVHRFTVEEYRRLGEVGFLTPEDRVELLEGWIVRKMNLNPAHSVTVQTTSDLIRAALPDGWCIRTQDAVTTEDSEPEPDVAVVRGQHRDYSSGHPRADQAALIIEVADSSLERDRYKCQIYARSGFPIYWIINLVDRRVEVYSNPTGSDPKPAYRRRDDYGPEQSVPVVIEDHEVAALGVSEMLP